VGQDQQLQLNLGKSEKLHSNLGEIKIIGISWKHLGEVSQIKIWQFATVSFNSGQLQTVLFKVRLYGIAALKFECI